MLDLDWRIEQQNHLSRHTWAESNVAELALGLGSVARPSSVLGRSAHPSAGAMTPPAGERAEAPRGPLLPHAVHCQQRRRVKTHARRQHHAPTHTYHHSSAAEKHFQHRLNEPVYQQLFRHGNASKQLHRFSFPSRFTFPDRMPLCPRTQHRRHSFVSG